LHGLRIEKIIGTAWISCYTFSFATALMDMVFEVNVFLLFHWEIMVVAFSVNMVVCK
jgi:hypothetical protein